MVDLVESDVVFDRLKNSKSNGFGRPGEPFNPKGRGFSGLWRSNLPTFCCHGADSLTSLGFSTGNLTFTSMLNQISVALKNFVPDCEFLPYLGSLPLSGFGRFSFGRLGTI